MINEIECFILDDERSAVEDIEGYVLKTPGLKLAGSSTNPYEAIELIQGTDMLVFLDIRMGRVSGIEYAKNLTNKIIFTTAHDEYALESFDNENTVDYLLKPIYYDRFLRAVRKAGAFINSQETYIDNDIVRFKVDGKVIKLDVDSIDYISAMGNYSNVYYTGGKILVPLSLSNIETMLPKEVFTRAHKSHIVNRLKVDSRGGDSLTLKGGQQLRLGRSYKQNLDNL